MSLAKALPRHRLRRIEQRIGHEFGRPDLLREALIHSSFINENEDPELLSNERLEFLGDAILGSIVARELFERFPHADEGWLTVARSQIVRNEALAEIAAGLQLGNELLMGAGIDNAGARTRPVVLGRALEAVIGAVWLDGGQRAVQKLVRRLVRTALETITVEGVRTDPKTQLQTRLQGTIGVTPRYETIEASGPAHDRRFLVRVCIDGQPAAEGSGRSKQAAEMAAAELALLGLARFARRARGGRLMRLRSVDIGGYKSFGVRTELRFDGGMTAVVGPNGSGKSNIMDALRWVVGEGANRNLRVKRLDDVIFTGSSERAPAGLAEVRLRLDNSDGWLGLDAAEVEVQRRVHRDGESEFRLNGRAVRLRDIQDLFHNSGLGSGGYALMGQGLVDEVLRLRPQERRRLIEEVADVRRHRRKMLESRRQRERAEQHLDRARLLRDELAPRLRSLERQARRARRHEELQAELNTALGAWYGGSARALAAQLAERADAATSAAAAQQQAGLELSAAGAAVTASEQAVEAARADANAAAADRRAAEAKVNELRHGLELDQRRHDWLQSEAASIESGRDPAEDALAPAPDLASAEAALRAAEASLHDAREQRDRTLREHDARLQRRAEAAALTRRLDAERAQLRGEAQALGRTWPTRLTTLHDLEQSRTEAREAAADVATALEAARADEARADRRSTGRARCARCDHRQARRDPTRDRRPRSPHRRVGGAGRTDCQQWRVGRLSQRRRAAIALAAAGSTGLRSRC